MLPCDLCTEFPLAKLADAHRAGGAALTMLLKEAPEDESKPSAKRAPRPGGVDMIAVCSRTDRVVHMSSLGDSSSSASAAAAASADSSDGSVTIAKPVLKRCTDIMLHTNLDDAHAYVLAPWVIDLLVEDHSIHSIKVRESAMNPLWPLMRPHLSAERPSATSH